MSWLFKDVPILELEEKKWLLTDNLSDASDPVYVYGMIRQIEDEIERQRKETQK